MGVRCRTKGSCSITIGTTETIHQLQGHIPPSVPSTLPGYLAPGTKPRSQIQMIPDSDLTDRLAG
jgi:hypothetical protein